jgi:hypothetical protein
MKSKRDLLVLGIYALRLLGCLAVPYLFFLSSYNGLALGFALTLVFTALQNYYVASAYSGEKWDALHLLDSVCNKISLVTFFFILMFLNCCPPYFVALLITVTLVQATGILYLKWPDRKPHVKHIALTPLRIGNINFSIQVGWIFSILVLLAIQIRRPDWIAPVKYVEWTVYLGLAGFQSYVFYCYCLRLHRYFLPGFRPFSTNG